MAEQSPTDSRRAFLRDTGTIALAATAAAGAAHLAGARAAGQQTMPRMGMKGKQIIPGSPSKSYSRAVRLDRLVFVAGCVGTYTRGQETTIDPDFDAQASRTLLNLKKSIEDSGSSMGRVLKCGCFLKELEHFGKFNEIYTKFFPDGPPARSTVIVKDLVVPGALLEVDCVCYVD